jgi:RND family efflux transporter MFP subunit
MQKFLFPLILSFAVLASCGGKAPRSEGAPQPAPVPVKVTTVASANWPNVYEATGTVRARTAAVLASKLMGYVREAGFQAGDPVQEGQLLISIDSRDTDSQYRQAEAARNEALAARPEVENAVAAAQANLDLANVTLRRMKDLFDKKSISNQELDEASARQKAAQAGFEMARSKQAQLAARIAQAEEAVKAAAVARGYSEIRAPFAGTVTEKRVEPGNLATPGAPLATIEREGAYRLEAAVDESRLRDIRAGQAVSVTLDALGKTLPARVGEIVPAVDTASRSYTVKIDLPSLPGLRSGLFGRAAFDVGKRSVLAIPAGAIRQQGQLVSIFVTEAGVARARLVTLGESRADAREVISGLSSGERIVFPVPDGLTDGARVEVRP